MQNASFPKFAQILLHGATMFELVFTGAYGDLVSPLHPFFSFLNIFVVVVLREGHQQKFYARIWVGIILIHLKVGLHR